MGERAPAPSAQPREFAGDADRYPMLMTRAWPFRELVGEFDAYQAERHLPELMNAPGAAMVGYYENVVADLPQVYKGSGNRLANYVARTIDDLFCWLRSAEFAAAVEDGGNRWFGRMNELDYDLYTGNVYCISEVAKSRDEPTRLDLPLLVERFEVTDDALEEFDLWMSTVHLPGIASQRGVVRARSCAAVREGIPLPYYTSPGNRMLIADLEDDEPPPRDTAQARHYRRRGGVAEVGSALAIRPARRLPLPVAIRSPSMTRTFERPARMSRLALGGYPLGGGYGALDEAQSRATVDAALEAGLTLIDTAEAYLDSEERLGRILRGRRDDVFLATKFFPCEPYSYESIEAALEGSLRRLQTDRIDLYQVHGPEEWLGPLARRTPMHELAESLTRLRASGKALRIGICNLPVPELDELASRTEIFSTQNLYSIIDRGDEPDFLHLSVEAEVLAVCGVAWHRVPGLQPLE